MASDNRTHTVSEIIDDRPLCRFQIQTMLLCGLVLVLDGFATQSIGFLAPSMAESLHVSVRTFGPVFASALIGLMLSSMAAGPIADRIGRKVPIVIATLVFGVFSVATASATSFNQLVLFRFLSGLGFGAAIPNAVALTAEYAPRRLQQTVITILFASMPLGALLGGVVSTVLLPHLGWRSVYYVGGILPIVTALALVWLLPESLRFLSTRNADPKPIHAILAKIAPDLSVARVQTRSSAVVSSTRGLSVSQLFSEGRTVGTISLWIPFFMSLLMLYFILNWLPTLMRQTNAPLLAGVFGVSLFSLGGILGSILQGRMMTAWGSVRVLLVEFVASFLLIGSLAFVSRLSLILTVAFLCGCFLQGAQAGLNALSATFYPTTIRSTGVGWALGVGRLGSILGPLLGGVMLAHQWSLAQIFFAGAVPAILAAVAVAFGRAGTGISPYRMQVEASDISRATLVQAPVPAWKAE